MLKSTFYEYATRENIGARGGGLWQLPHTRPQRLEFESRDDICCFRENTLNCSLVFSWLRLILGILTCGEKYPCSGYNACFKDKTLFLFGLLHIVAFSVVIF